MTDEQIKQNADVYAELLTAGNKEHYRTIYTAAKEGYETGAHSRDEEVKELRNPWISIEDRLPEARDGYEGFSKNVLVLYRDQETGTSYITEAYYDFEYKGDGGWVLANDDDEHFFYSDCQENGYIVTHWMPIPELPKGSEI